MKSLIEYAKENIITEEIRKVATSENVDTYWLCNEISKGRVVILKNKHHTVDPLGIGKGLRTKINANIGTSKGNCDISREIEKLKIAEKFGADTIMDLSIAGDLDQILKKIIDESHVPVGTVPIYAVASKHLEKNYSISQIHPDDLLDEIDKQGRMGVDFMTLHCGVNKHSISMIKETDRICGIVSRGGTIMKQWIKATNKENPLYERFDEVLEICKKYEITISLGDGLRPGACHDANDKAQITELILLGELTKRAHEKGVQVMIEGPGHTPLHKIESIIRLMKDICNEAPLYVLGPLTIDNAPGYDHIVGAIGGAIAALNGANFLCYVTPAEHLCLPTIEDVKNGVIASKIAALSADYGKKMAYAEKESYEMSIARKKLDWQKMFKLALDPELAMNRKKQTSIDEDYCSMCGELCAIKLNAIC
ncbi:MAG: phosphomethylpyrimidine synthase ThiC [Bacteroidales bacterium]|nr:phosphomethylpyrimidine synthase ThiC [Bacteroidales bacterium]